MAEAGSYYDCHDILSEQTLIPSVFQTGAIGIGRILDPSSGSTDLQQGSKAEIPFWLIKSLAQRRMVELRMPRCYSKKMREKVQAGAEFLNLREACPYFYDLGIKLNDLVADDELPSILFHTFRIRYGELLTTSQTHDPKQQGMEVMSLKHKLTVEELQLFEGGSSGVADFDFWRYTNTISGSKRKHRATH